MMLRAADDVSRAGASARDGASAWSVAGLLHPPAVEDAGVRETALERVLRRGRAAERPEAPGIVAVRAEREVTLARCTLERLVDLDLVRDARRRRDDDRVELANADPAFAPRRYRVGPAIPSSPPGDWANYHKAAAQALAAELARRRLARLPGGAFRIDGRVPAAAGLSSSSALLVACGLAHLTLAGVELPRPELAELFARAERYVGTLGGGMDQATALLAQAGQALRIDFFPLRASRARSTGVRLRRRTQPPARREVGGGARPLQPAGHRVRARLCRP